MSTNPDPTTDADEAAMERAAQADLRPASLKQSRGASEHPSGLATGANAEPERAHDGPVVRRHARSHDQER